jgi:predicted PurR-regulated permease PerM
MPGFDRRAASYTWTVAVVVLLLVLVFLVRRTLFVFTLAVLFAYLLAPLVDIIDRVLPLQRTRTLALALAYMLVVGILVFALGQIGSRVIDEANTLIKTVPDLLSKWQQPIQGATPAVNSFKEQMVAKVREALYQGGSNLLSEIPKAGLRVISVFTHLIDIVIVPILSFFFLKDGRRIRDQGLELLGDGPKRELLEDVLSDVNLLLAQYMRALLTLCSATFISYSIFFAIFGVPYGILLAALAFALEFIPMIGPLTAAIVVITVVALSGGGVVKVVVFLFIYRLFQDYVLSPNVMGSGLELHPLMILFGVFAGAEVAGIAGAFLSVPILALVRISYIRLRKSRVKARLAPEPPVPAVTPVP